MPGGFITGDEAEALIVFGLIFFSFSLEVLRRTAMGR